MNKSAKGTSTCQDVSFVPKFFKLKKNFLADCFEEMLIYNAEMMCWQATGHLGMTDMVHQD